MPTFGRDRKETEKRIGHTSQLGGLRLHTLAEGRAAGTRAVDFRTASGLDFTVLLDRAMDISEARYKGMSLCWRSPAGDAAPAFYEAEASGWLRTFCGGLMTTCGLTQSGPPHTDEGEALGLHGRISTTPAERVSVREEWEREVLVMEVSGVVREARLFGPGLEMHRRVSARSDSAGLVVRDHIVNAGARPAPVMLLYHINTGFPLLDDASELVLPSSKSEPRDAEAADGAEKWAEMHAPVTGYAEKVYFHTVKPDSDGWVTCALINRGLGDGVGLRLRYRLEELPFLTQWKMLGDREYVLGIEPGNCKPIGRAAAREAGELAELAAGEEIDTGFEIAVVEGEEGLEGLVQEATAG